MSFERGSITLRVFKARPGSTMPSDAIERIAKDAIQPMELIPEEGSCGWATGRYLLDRNITEESVTVAGRIRLTLVKAEKKIPAALFKAECKQEELAALSASGKNFLNRQERSEIAKAVKDRMFPAMPPSLSGIDVVRSDTEFYSTASSDKQVDLLTSSWKKTIGSEIFPYTPTLAAQMLGKYDLKSLKSTSFSAEMTDAEVEQDLGLEFLTWLWYYSEVCGGINDNYGFALEGPFTFVHEGNGAHEIVVRKGNPGIAKEAKSALLAGKKLKKAKLTVVKGDLAWTCSIDGREWTFGSLKLPKSEMVDPVGVFEERMLSIGYFIEAIEGVFKKFLSIRTDGAKWNKEIEGIRSWVEDRAEQA